MTPFPGGWAAALHGRAPRQARRRVPWGGRAPDRATSSDSQSDPFHCGPEYQSPRVTRFSKPIVLQYSLVGSIRRSLSNLIRCQERDAGPCQVCPPGTPGGSVGRMYIQSKCLLQLPVQTSVYMDLGADTRALESVPGLTSLSRKFNEPQAELNHRFFFRDAESTLRCQMRVILISTSAGPRRAPVVGFCCHVWRDHAQPTPTPLRNLPLRPCSIRVARLRQRAAASTAFQS